MEYKRKSSLPKEEEFFNLIELYKVTACFFGHYHVYRRGRIKETNLIVVGGGGGRLKSWQSQWGKFHYLLKITVYEDGILEDILAYNEGEIVFIWKVKKWIFFNILPFVKNYIY